MIVQISDSLDIRGRNFHNRGVLAPLVPNCAELDGSVSDTYRQFYQARAHVGFMVLGSAYVHPDGRGFNRQIGIYDDKLISGLADLAQALKEKISIPIIGVGRLD
jgi:2,4-dienoyl-CoA reductase-like NADH-dependent reductase (Old Yellow Enzyme family)